MNTRASLTAGICALALMVVGPFSLVWVPEQTTLPGDLAATAALQAANPLLVRAGLAGEMGIVAIELVMSLALLALFERTRRHGARLAAVSRLAMAAVQATTALAGLGALSMFTDGATDAGGGLLALRAAGVLGWQALFGLHCAILAGLLARTRIAPWPFTVGMALSAVGYLLVGLGGMLFPAKQALLSSAPITIAMLGEVPFFFWLLARGVKRGA